MTALTNQPSSFNFASPLSFVMRLQRNPTMNFDVIRTNVPGLTLGPAPDFPNPFTNIPLTGDHVEFEMLQVTFKVDEALANYRDIHNWMRGIGFTDNYDQYKALNDNQEYTGLGVKSDLTVVFLDSSRKGIIGVTYHDAFPVQLSGLQYDTTLTGINYLNATANFRYTTFDFNTDL